MGIMKTFKAADGIVWGVKVENPGSSNAIIHFRHPDGRSSRLDRYNWIISNGPEARSVTSRLDTERVEEQLDETALKRLFARSMPVSRRDPLTNAPEETAG
jgi:hypothetical protein